MMRRPAPDVTLATAETVRDLLSRAGVPVSRNWLLVQLQARGRGTTRPRLNRALAFFLDMGLVVEGSKGLQWTFSPSASLRNAAASGRKL